MKKVHSPLLRPVTILLIVLPMLVTVNAMFAQNNSPLCFTARDGSVDVRFVIKNITHTIQYSTDSVNWNTYTSNDSIHLTANQSILFRAAVDQTVATSFSSIYYDQSRFYFNSTDGGTIEGSGNIMSLYGSTCPNLPLQYCAFAFMFDQCTILTTAPELPATNLAAQCYTNMFSGCTSLTKAPILPATTVIYYCYHDMFNGCTSLTTAPALPATTLTSGCYEGMFYNCSSLMLAPDLPATTVADYCYRRMFTGCISLTTAPNLPTTTLEDHCYELMFSGCTSLTSAPALPATSLANYCYDYMFAGCTSLSVAPALSATTLATGCYEGMFSQCTSLITAPALPATTLIAHCYNEMFSYCTNLIVAPELPASTLAYSCYNHMFSRCSSLLTAPALPATTLADKCYECMFSWCTSLSSIPALPATSLTANCYFQMFWYCNSLVVNTTNPGSEWIIPAVSTAPNALDDMFTGTSGTMNGTPSIGTTYYIPARFNISAISNDSTMGYVSGGGIYTEGSTAILTAMPNTGYTFTRWNNGETDRVLYVTVVSDTIITAMFEPIPSSVDNVEGKNYIVYSNGNSIHINGAAGEPIRIYDINGKLISEVEEASDEQIVSVYVSGVYFVRINEKKSIKVVVK